MLHIKGAIEGYRGKERVRVTLTSITDSLIVNVGKEVKRTKKDEDENEVAQAKT